MNPLFLFGAAGAALGLFLALRTDGDPAVAAPSPPPASGAPPATPKAYQLAAGKHYNFTQRVFSVPDQAEAQRVVDSLKGRGHFNVIAKIEPSRSAWLLNYDSFEMPSDGVVTQGQKSQLGPYVSELLEVRDVGDLPTLFA